MNNKKLRSTKEYREWRKAVFERDNYTCQECGSIEHLEAHHIKEVSKFPELVYEINNGLTLCHECHTKTESYFYFKTPVKKALNNVIKEPKVTIRIPETLKAKIQQVANELNMSFNDAIKTVLFAGLK